jgi:hypothetical protein
MTCATIKKYADTGTPTKTLCTQSTVESCLYVLGYQRTQVSVCLVYYMQLRTSGR